MAKKASNLLRVVSGVGTPLECRCTLVAESSNRYIAFDKQNVVVVSEGKMVLRAVVRVKYHHNPQWLMAITL